jgi:multidrug efflux pump
MFGEREVSTFINRGDEYPVIMRARAEDRATTADLAQHLHRAPERRARGRSPPSSR